MLWRCVEENDVGRILGAKVSVQLPYNMTGPATANHKISDIDLRKWVAAKMLP